jgi:hypothetical protein
MVEGSIERCSDSAPERRSVVSEPGQNAIASKADARALSRPGEQSWSWICPVGEDRRTNVLLDALNR